MVLVYILVGIVALIVFVQVRQTMAFHSKETCSICGEQSGGEGNVTFALADGYACQHCIAKTLTDGSQMKGLGPNAYSSRTVDDISTTIQRRVALGDRNWIAEKNEERNAALARFAALKEVDTIPKCPKCGSTSISADKKGFSAGKAAAGAILAGPIGLAAGGLGANKVQITCLNCGHQWTAGKPQ